MKLCNLCCDRFTMASLYLIVMCILYYESEGILIIYTLSEK